MIGLDNEEKQLLASIELDAMKLTRTPGQPAIENCERAALLTERLLQRGAIPEHRLKAFVDPEYATRRWSPLEQFKRNGNSKDETLRHPHFLKYLRYFIYGPNLPAALIQSFEDKIEDLGGSISSSDHVPLMKHTRTLARQFQTLKSDADEFFRLALECGVYVAWAHSVYRAAYTAGRNS